MKAISSLVKTLKVFSITADHLKRARKDDNHLPIKKSWADQMTNHLKMDVIKSGDLQFIEGPALFVGNHVSYLDIPLLVSCVPELTFVSKIEVKSWPVIGQAAVKAGTLFVDRKSKNSRQNIKDEVTARARNENLKLIVFPSGTTTLGPSERWKKGILEIAEQNNIPIIAFRIRYLPERKVAYIDQDNFFTHLYQLTQIDNIHSSIKFHSPLHITNITEQMNYLKDWSENKT